MQPNDSLAEAIGLIGYAAGGDGIGGVLKSRVADFRVDEIATTIAPVSYTHLTLPTTPYV